MSIIIIPADLLVTGTVSLLLCYLDNWTPESGNYDKVVLNLDSALPIVTGAQYIENNKGT